jgi:hypothetical protein
MVAMPTPSSTRHKMFSSSIIPPSRPEGGYA